MIKACFIFITVIILSQVSHSQTYFNNEYKNDSIVYNNGAAIYPLKDSSGYITTGIVTTNESSYIGLFRLDINGDTIWTKVFGKYLFYQNGGLGKLISIGDTNFVFAGIMFTDSITHSSDSALIALYKFDIDGNFLWEKYFGDSNKKTYGNDIQQTLDNGFIITGWTTGWGNFSSNSSFLLKVDSLGNEQWHKVYASSNQRAAYSVDLTNDGYILSGTYYSSIATKQDINVIRTDSLGNIIWNKVYGTPEDDNYGYVVRYGNTNDYIVTATIDVTPGNILADFQAYIAKIDGSGNIIWDDTLGIIQNGIHDAFSSNAIILPDGSIITIGGTNYSSTGDGDDAWLAKYDGNGNFLWQRIFDKYGANNVNYFWDVQHTLDGGFVMCGDLTNVSVPEQNLWVVKVDSMGCEIPNCTVGVEDELNLNEVLVYPNPSNGIINIDQSQSNTTFLLIDITGKEMLRKKLTTNYTTLDISSFPKGIYFYQTLNNYNRSSGKLIIH
ncbi:MAG: T9SS type A sorting domain-containing protein [Flavobacteriales bacterium]|nr:T9SS type A sorting domain-containing protein [Flavobacteriales bacterium]MCB9335618.1 T9SS type A sorting domain-containing protein [Flavobacteriales bacterium]